MLTALVVAAGTVSAVYWISTREPSSPVLPDDGPTLYQALGQVDLTVSTTAGGPWVLFSYVGFAPEGPFSPEAFGFSNSTNLTLKYCAAQFNGLTVWNGTSFPIFHGSIASGNATFWQFSYLSNASHEFLLATDTLGVSRVYPPIPQNNECAEQSTMTASALSYPSWVNPLPVDTSVQAANAYGIAGKGFQAEHSTLVEIFANGWTDFSDAFNHGPGGGVDYTLCGLPGEAGVEAKSFVGEFPDGEVQSIFNGTLSCTAVREPGPPVIYQNYSVAFSPPGSMVGVSDRLAGLSVQFQVEFPDWFSNETTPYYDGWGLTAWMTTIALLSSANQPVPASAPTCREWVPSVADCNDTGSGWFVVLLSATGGWMDAFPASADAAEWSVPNVPVVGAEQLVVVYPSSWNVSGDLVELAATGSIPVVSGSAPL
jgi:hypothetical protein